MLTAQQITVAYVPSQGFAILPPQTLPFILRAVHAISTNGAAVNVCPFVRLTFGGVAIVYEVNGAVQLLNSTQHFSAGIACQQDSFSLSGTDTAVVCPLPSGLVMDTGWEVRYGLRFFDGTEIVTDLNFAIEFLE